MAVLAANALLKWENNGRATVFKKISEAGELFMKHQYGVKEQRVKNKKNSRRILK
jgi:hypothetical protein